MPGIIQVSVLSFDGSQSSSSSTPQFSIKVSMGKREYQTREKGEFSFPVTTLRDNLIVKLLDEEGNELSHTDIEPRLVIKKGTWEDTFLLEGGGQVQMKLQFVLNDEDRQRIRTMRESALRKKHELLNSDVASSRNLNHEVSELDQAGLTSPEGKSGADNRERTRSVEKKMNPMKRVKSGSLNEKSAVGSFQKDNPVVKQVFPEELVRNSGSTIAVKGKVSVEQDEVTVKGNQRAEQKPLSRVKNMISAFECGHNQEKRSEAGPLTLKSQSSKTGVNFLYEEGNVKTAPTSIENEEQPSDLTASVSGRVHNDQRCSGSHLFGKTNNGSREKCSENIDIQEFCREEHSGAWIFPGEGKHYCITAGGKQIMNLIESCQAAAKSFPGMMSSFIGGNLKESVEHDANEVESDGSPNGENPRGLLGQVVRAAIIVGFATLVFFTRKRSPDPKKAKEAKAAE